MLNVQCYIAYSLGSIYVFLLTKWPARLTVGPYSRNTCYCWSITTTYLQFPFGWMILNLALVVFIPVFQNREWWQVILSKYCLHLSVSWAWRATNEIVMYVTKKLLNDKFFLSFLSVIQLELSVVSLTCSVSITYYALLLITSCIIVKQ